MVKLRFEASTPDARTAARPSAVSLALMMKRSQEGGSLAPAVQVTVVDSTTMAGFGTLSVSAVAAVTAKANALLYAPI